METHFNVSLFWISTLSGLLGAFIPSLVKMVVNLITRESDMETNLRRQVCDLKAELGSVSMVDEFAKYAKINRKITKASEELSHQSDARSSYRGKLQFILKSCLYTLLGCGVALLLWNNRKEPVVILPENWLYPFESILSYPSGITGGISLTVWIFISRSVGVSITKALKL